VDRDREPLPDRCLKRSVRRRSCQSHEMMRRHGMLGTKNLIPKLDFVNEGFLPGRRDRRIPDIVPK